MIIDTVMIQQFMDGTYVAKPTPQAKNSGMVIDPVLIQHRMNGNYAYEAPPQPKDSINHQVCRGSVLGLGASGGIAGAATAAGLGTGVCGLAALGYPGCVAAFAAGGGAVGALGGLFGALNTPSCQKANEEAGARAKANRAGQQNYHSPANLPDCPVHGVPHSCPSAPPAFRPAPAKAAPSRGGCSGRACPPGGGGGGDGGGGSCGIGGGGGGCGCGC